jgi:hypothetical protein
MTSIVAPMCLWCRHYHRHPNRTRLTCDAYPQGIPDAIIESRADHRLTYPATTACALRPWMPRPRPRRPGCSPALIRTDPTQPQSGRHAPWRPGPQWHVLDRAANLGPEVPGGHSGVA